MGTLVEHSGLGEALFTKTQRQILGLLYGRPEQSYYLNEIVRAAGGGIGGVQRELEKLTRAGLLTVSKVGNQKHYRANPQAPIFAELRGIVQKTMGVGEVLRQALAPLAARIAVAFVYGSIAKGSDTAGSDIDLLLIAEELSYGEVLGVCSAAEAQLGRPVRPTLYQPAEFRAKLAADSSFVSRVVAQPKIFLIGTDDDLSQPG